LTPAVPDMNVLTQEWQEVAELRRIAH